MSKDSGASPATMSSKKQHIDSALAAWAGPEAVPSMSSSTPGSGTLTKSKGKASSRMFKHLVRHTSIKDNRDSVDCMYYCLFVCCFFKKKERQLILTFFSFHLIFLLLLLPQYNNNSQFKLVCRC